jgi:hypothetical protein
MQFKMRCIQALNDQSTDALTTRGYAGAAMKVKLRPRSEALTVWPASQAYGPEQIQRLAAASTAGQKFLATAGGHLTADNFFLGAEKKENKVRRKDLLKEKEHKHEMVEQELEALLLSLLATVMMMRIFLRQT